VKQPQYNATVQADSTATLADADESSNKAQILRRLLKTRAMLQESRNSSAELQTALERFKYQQSKIAGN